MYANAQRKSSLRATMAASNPAYTLGGFIHIPLVVAIIAVLLRVINGRTPL